MIKVGDKRWDALTDAEKIGFCDDNLLTPCDNERRIITWDWYLSKMFIDGHHYVYYNSASNTIETPPRRRDAIRLVINKTKSSMRAVANYATRFRPKFEVLPQDTDDDTIINARRAGKLLDYLFDKLYLRKKIRLLINNSLWTSVGIWELGWDDKGEGEVIVENHDPFDIYLPLHAYLEGPTIISPFVGKVIPRGVDVIKNDERYDEKARSEVTADGVIAFSEMKKRIRQKSGQDEKSQEGQETALVRELMLWDAEGNEKDGNVNLFTYCGDKILRDEPLEDKEYPLYVYQPEDSDSLYSIPWVKNIIPINKMIDRLESQVLEYNNKMLRARIIAEKGHGVNLAASGKDGAFEVEVIEVAPGRSFKQFDLQPLPLTIHRQIDNANGYLEDISGAHEASLGAIPSGARSGKTLEALQAADSNNLAGIKENLEDFLSVIGSRILNIIADKYVASRVIKLSEPEETGEEALRYGGENAPEREGLVKITKNNEVRVSIGSWLGYTREAQRDTIIELAGLGIIPADEVLRQFEFPNVELLSERARSERLEKDQMKAVIAGRGEPVEGEEPAPFQGGGTDMESLADEENARMMNGEQLPPTQGATPEHTQAHIDFLQSQDVQSNRQAVEVITTHADGEIEQQMAAYPAR